MAICKNCLGKVISKKEEPKMFDYESRKEYSHYCENCDLFLHEYDVAKSVTIDENGHREFIPFNRKIITIGLSEEDFDALFNDCTLEILQDDLVINLYKED